MSEDLRKPNFDDPVEYLADPRQLVAPPGNYANTSPNQPVAIDIKVVIHHTIVVQSFAETSPRQ